MVRGRERGGANYDRDRIEFILRGISGGKSAGRIQRELASGLGGQIAGSKSELRVSGILRNLEAVTFIQRAAANSAADIAGRDLTVYLAPQIDRPLVSVGVQVKSSDDRIWEFRERLLRQLGVNSQTEVTNWLRTSGLIIINGNAKVFTIKKYFASEVDAIRDTIHGN